MDTNRPHTKGLDKPKVRVDWKIVNNILEHVDVVSLDCESTYSIEIYINNCLHSTQWSNIYGNCRSSIFSNINGTTYVKLTNTLDRSETITYNIGTGVHRIFLIKDINDLYLDTYISSFTIIENSSRFNSKSEAEHWIKQNNHIISTMYSSHLPLKIIEMYDFR